MANWVETIRAARKETAEGDTLCRGCDDPDKGKFMLVVAEAGLNEQAPQQRVRMCEPCAMLWLQGDSAVREKVGGLWKSL